jgi:uncharacterized alpha-E superfamily protein
MLSRIAESLFWIGRYLERADDTARILEVQVHQLLEDVSADEESVSRSLLSALGVPTPTAEVTDLDEVINVLSFNLELPGSIISSVTGARENARGIRESLSTELWECLNVTHNTLLARSMTLATVGPHEFFRFARHIKERVALASGIAEMTMVRDAGWHFLTLGRSLERIDMTVRLLGVRHAFAANANEWIATLRSCSAHEAYLRTYGGEIVGQNVVEFLLLDRLFPRSVHFALNEAEIALEQLSPGTGRSGSVGKAQRVLGRARALLDYHDIRELYDDLPATLLSLQAVCSETSVAVAERYFRVRTTMQWQIDDPVFH